MPIPMFIFSNMNTKTLVADKSYIKYQHPRSCDKTLKLVDVHCILLFDKLIKENWIINASMNKVILVYFFFHKGLSVNIYLSDFLSAGMDKLYLN